MTAQMTLLKPSLPSAYLANPKAPVPYTATR